ncbi:hypothetical protein FQA39_LY06147 [Lamprigera yunnana]|nr:hypothetical protein FQA39_LY06147 [Lamprigera yunnana]
MDNLVFVRDANVGSRVQRGGHEDERAKEKKKKYLDPDPNLRKFKRLCSHAGKTYFCNKIRRSDVKLIRRKLYETPDKTEQDMKVLNLKYRITPLYPRQKKTLRTLMAEQFRQNSESQQNLEWYKRILSISETETNKANEQEDQDQDKDGEELKEEQAVHI